MFSHIYIDEFFFFSRISQNTNSTRPENSGKDLLVDAVVLNIVLRKKKNETKLAFKIHSNVTKRVFVGSSIAVRLILRFDSISLGCCPLYGKIRTAYSNNGRSR